MTADGEHGNSGLRGQGDEGRSAPGGPARVAPMLGLMSAFVLMACGDSNGGIVVTVESVSAPAAPIASLLVEGASQESDWTAMSVFPPQNGETEITLPTTFALRLIGGSGSIEGFVDVCVTARDAAETGLAANCEVADVARGAVTDVTVTLDFNPGIDGGLPDLGTESGPGCGNGVLEAPEDCDGADVGGQDCVSLGLGMGTLGCMSDCTLDISGCADAPTVPVLRRPINGSYVGSIHIPGSMRPTFEWEASAAGPGATISYELSYSEDDTFPAADTTNVMIPSAGYQPAADLPGSPSIPLGARYWWHVRACVGSFCSAWSPTWYVHVGRSKRDFNGDSYADVIIGALWASEPVVAAGAVYMYNSGPAGVPVNTPTTVLGGALSDDLFGWSVRPAGDVNGDGFEDLIVGAPQYWWNTGTGPGAAYLYFGGGPGPFDTTPDATLTGDTFEERFGFGVSAAGDVNGDGYADVIVGAPGNDAGGTNAGRAYVYFGGSGPFDLTADGVITGMGTLSLGTFAAGAGDVNGDGFHDVLVNAGFAGEAHLFLGGPGSTFDETPDVALTGSGGDAVEWLSAAGDVNADGFSDFVLSNPESDVAGMDAGAAYVFLGGHDPIAATPAATLLGAAAGDRFGLSAPAGDFNGDGFDDIVVGALFADTAYVFYGGPGMGFDTTANGTLVNPGAPMNGFGPRVGPAGDVNFDGLDDVLVGAPSDDTLGMDRGRAYLYVGNTAAMFTITSMVASYTGEMDGDYFGVW